MRMAWIVLTLEASYGARLERIRKSIQRFNTDVGSTGYHETLTVAFTQLIHFGPFWLRMAKATDQFADSHSGASAGKRRGVFPPL